MGAVLSKIIPGTIIGLQGRDVNAHRDVNIHIINNASSSASAPIDKKSADPFRSNMPLSTSHYQGHKYILDGIFNHFTRVSTQPTECCTRVVAITGMGGIGKSETACKFAMQYKQIYPCAAWINAETEQTTRDSFLSLANSLGVVFDGEPPADLELVKRVYRHIDAKYLDPVLLIFDNAIQLTSRENENEFGIMNYLPTNDLPNERVPFVIITSQTPNWQQGITTFKLDKLEEDESLSFFRSTFKISSLECDEEFRELHSHLYSHLQGYPLAMILAASNIDFERGTNSVNWLKQEIEEYIEKFENEDSSILTEKISQNWPSDYNKTLSTVWKLTLQRLQAALNGPNALVVLQAVSFFHVPLTQDDLRCVFIECPHCPGTPDWMKNTRLKESIVLLQKFHLVDCDFQDWNHSNELAALRSSGEISSEDLPRVRKEIKRAKNFKCELRAHRLVQLVVRLDTDCGVVLGDILRYKAFWTGTHVRQLNTPAVEQALGRSRLSTRALAFVGLLALKGNLAAQKIVETRSPRSDPAATIWRVLKLDKKTLNEKTIEVLRAFVGLSTSEKRLIDKRCFAQMAMEMFYPKIILSYGTSAQGLELQSFTGIQDIACKLFSTGCYFKDDVDICSLPLLCVNKERSTAATYTLRMGNKLIQDLKARKPEPEIAPIIDQLGAYRAFVDGGKDKWHLYWEAMEEIFHSDDSWAKFKSEVESCGLDQVKLKQVFSSYFDKIWQATEKTNFNYSKRVCYYFRDLDGFLYGFFERTPSRQTLNSLMESFIEMLEKRDQEQLLASQKLKGNYILFIGVWICSTWVYLCLQKTHLSSTELFTQFSHVGILRNIKKLTTDEIRACLKYFNDWELLQTRHKERYKDFLERYSKSTVKDISSLVPFCINIQNQLNEYCN